MAALRTELASQPVKVPASIAVQMLAESDAHLLADRLHGRCGEGSIAVVGLRTGGVYLGLAMAQRLAELGRIVSFGTTRPSSAIKDLARLALTADIIAVVDDPPLTGQALLTVAAASRSLALPNLYLCAPIFWVCSTTSSMGSPSGWTLGLVCTRCVLTRQLCH